jgi:organic radical activating enzyme
MNEIKISEIFSSYQGEGLYAGQRHIFVRFYGCNLKCSYCDEIEKRYEVYDMKKIISEIKKLSKKENIKTISFTGGEPLLYADEIENIIKKLNGYKVMLETNGILYEELKKIIKFIDIVSMDIKLPQYIRANKFIEHSKFLYTAKDKAYVKVVFDGKANIKDFKKAVDVVDRVSKKIPFFIQPISGKKLDFNIIDKLYYIASDKLYDVRFLPQIHKLIKVK